MKVLYIGQYSPGTTSKMRADRIFHVLEVGNFDVIDTHVPFYNTLRLWRSLGFRYRRGPLILNVNSYIFEQFKRTDYDLIWVDKGLFIQERIMKLLRQYAQRLVHYTPDPAFTYNKSKLFEQSIPYYDYLITTKSFELDFYHQKVDSSKVIYTTQGFDKAIHKKSENSSFSKRGVVFIGRYEKEREVVIKQLLENNILVTLAGSRWKSFANANKTDVNLNYLGKGVYGQDYVQQIQQSKIAWGALSKWFLELHTTRTFEIPACGTALLTERNQETTSFFMEDEAVFYENPSELMEKVNFFLNNEEELKKITARGYEKVHTSGYDYESILRNLLKTIMS